MELPDSGERRKFSTGAVRDIADGKGRCDLLPLDVVERIIDWETSWGERDDSRPTVFESIQYFIDTDDADHLVTAVCRFIQDAFNSDAFGTMIELSKHYEDGAKKYSPNNWKLGIDLHCFIDSAIRHYLKYLRGDTDEPHNRAVLWNLVGAIWTHDNHPELNDIHGG
jgi:hypothetical protein